MDRRRRHLLVVTTAATALTALAGIYTAEFGAGLACEARWPLCDGAVFGLFPATVPSFIEWFHRLLAMLTGLLVLATTGLVWRDGAARRIRLALVAALVLLPSQIVLGGLTVRTYELAVLTAHFATAALILALLVAATVWAYAETVTPTLGRLQQAALLALLGLPVLAVLTPRLLVAYRGAVQLAYYGTGFAVFAALCVVALWAREHEPAARRVGLAAATAAVLVVAVLVGGRLHFGDAGQLALVGLTVSAFAFTLAAALRTRRLAARPPTPVRG